MESCIFSQCMVLFNKSNDSKQLKSTGQESSNAEIADLSEIPIRGSNFHSPVLKIPPQKKSSKKFDLIFGLLCVLLGGYAFYIGLIVNTEEILSPKWGRAATISGINETSLAQYGQQPGKISDNVVTFYSENKELLFKVSADHYSIRERADSIVINPRDMKYNGTYATLKTLIRSEVNETFSQEGSLSGTSGIFINRTSQSVHLSDSIDELLTMYNTTLLKEVNDRYVMISIQEIGNTDDSDALIKDFESIIRSVVVQPPPDAIAQAVQGSVLGAENSLPNELEKATLLGKLATVHLYNRACLNLTVTEEASSLYLEQGTYPLCSTIFGNGFYVNSKGYLVSNASVVAPNSIDVAVVAAMAGHDPDSIGAMLLIEVLEALEEVSPGIEDSLSDPEVLEQVFMITALSIAESIEQGYFELSDPTYETYIEGPSTFEIDNSDYSLSSPEKHIKAEIIESNEAYSQYLVLSQMSHNEPVDLSTPNLALLKAEAGNNFVSLSLAPFTSIVPGSTVYTTTYLGDMTERILFDTVAEAEYLIISSFITDVETESNTSADYFLFDTETMVRTSGSPVISAGGEVIGIESIVVTPDSNSLTESVSSGIVSTEISELLKKSSIKNEVGDITNFVVGGIDNYSQSYFKKAVQDWNSAITLNSSLKEDLDPLIDAAQEKIDNGEDQTPATASFSPKNMSVSFTSALATVFSGSGTTIMTGAGGVILLGFVFIIMGVVMKDKPVVQPAYNGMSSSRASTTPSQFTIAPKNTPQMRIPHGAPSVNQTVSQNPVSAPTVSAPTVSAPTVSTQLQTAPSPLPSPAGNTVTVSHPAATSNTTVASYPAETGTQVMTSSSGTTPPIPSQTPQEVVSMRSQINNLASDTPSTQPVIPLPMQETSQLGVNPLTTQETPQQLTSITPPPFTPTSTPGGIASS